MQGMPLTFIRKVYATKDAMGGDVYSLSPITVDDCLIAPITEPANAREQQALTRSRDQVRIHLPKTFSGDVTNSDVEYNGKTFHLDSDSVEFMLANTPGRWNRYIRAEALNG